MSSLTQLRHATLLVPGHENSSVLQNDAKQVVCANAVFPGGTLTPFRLRAVDFQDRLAKISNEGRQNVPLGRRADAWEVAYPILWFASDEASYVSGSVLMVYGDQFTK
jgi:2-hydroxycyclohexanecarboxyl-CoA dehydrogenase